MESIGTLAGGIAHDFNNILMGIQGRTSLSLIDLPPTSPLKEHLVCIGEYVKSASNLTSQLLGFARSGRYSPQPSDINHMVEKSATMFGRTKKELTLTQSLQENLPTALVDRSQIEQILLNLYVNAWHAMPSGGHLEIATRCSNIGDDQVAVRHSTGQVYRNQRQRQRNGIEETIQNKIFEPFFTTNRGRGTAWAWHPPMESPGTIRGR
jgi:signal transduction histidine kinase